MALISLKQLGAGAYSGSFQVSGSTGVTGSLSLTGVTGTPNAKILINSSNIRLKSSSFNAKNGSNFVIIRCIA